MKRLALIALSFAALLAGCSDSQNSNSASDEQRFSVRGYVESIENDGSRLLIDHEEMPGYMPAMVMPFTLEDPSESNTLVPGDQIRFTYVVTPTRSWIQDLAPTGHRRKTQPSHVPDATVDAPLETGDSMPDYAFIDEERRSVRLSDYKGKVVALTFVFTRCPVPEYCPTMMRNFGNADALLKETPPVGPWKLVTISFDPEFDTPEVMKRYGKAFDYDPANWDLLTSDTLEPIRGIAKQVGLKFGEKDGSIIHNLRTVVLDTDGAIVKIFNDETWSPKDLAKVMRSAALK